MFKNFFRKFNKDYVQSADIDILWGGYYVSKEAQANEYTVFRLLDFNKDAYHAALFQEKFSKIPSLDEIRGLSPFIGHVPIDARGLLRVPVNLVGGVPLNGKDLEGYMIYLEHHDVPPEARIELEQRLVGFSHEPPLKLRLKIKNDELLISDRK